MLDTVSKTMSRYSMLRPGERVVAAVSGGPDSVCLLHVLKTLAPRIGFELAGVAHFNHKLRAEASDADQAFVAELAQRLGLPFHLASGAPGAGNLEQEARRARRAFFSALIDSRKADRIALGHTRDDQAETVLLRLARGSGLSGLAGILPVTEEGFVRPLFDVFRAEVEAYLRQHASLWREDHTNADLQFARNRIRREVLPALKTGFNPRVAESLAQLAEIARDEEAWWTEETRRLADRLCIRSQEGIEKDAIELRAAELSALPPALSRRLVRYALAQIRGDLRRIEFQHIEKVRELAASRVGAGRARLPGVTVTRSFDWIRLAAQPVAPLAIRQIRPPESHHVPGSHLSISFEVIEKTEKTPDHESLSPYGTLKGELCWNSMTASLELRSWQTGDSYRPLGHRRAYRLKELFENQRVPSWRRTNWPILLSRALGGPQRIVWAREFGVASGLEVPDGFEGPVLRIWEKPESFDRGSAS